MSIMYCGDQLSEEMAWIMKLVDSHMVLHNNDRFETNVIRQIIHVIESLDLECDVDLFFTSDEVDDGVNPAGALASGWFNVGLNEFKLLVGMERPRSRWVVYLRDDTIPAALKLMCGTEIVTEKIATKKTND